MKSKIQMDKRKLVNIIVKDLEELKFLSEEVADNQFNSSLIIDLAVNKARLLIQEIELLRELAVNSVSMQTETETDEEDIGFDDEEEDVSDISFPDPELEILHFEEGEFPENEELQEVEEPEDEDEEFVAEDQEDEEPELEEDEVLTEDEDVEEDEVELENTEVELEEDDLTGTEEEAIGEMDTEEEEDDEDERPLQKTNIEVTELSNSPQPGIREIQIDEFDDDDLGSIHFEPIHGSSDKPHMREIPKPDNTAVGKNYQKERSLNDSMGETKLESKLSNGPIASLRAAIGLNDRFLFIREIFNNNSEKYNAVIDHLDKMEQIQEAVEYLKANLSMEKNKTTMKFVDLLKRRFTK